MKINFDASVGFDCVPGLRMVVRDHEGEVLATVVLFQTMSYPRWWLLL